jgi:hypothetical protein
MHTGIYASGKSEKKLKRLSWLILKISPVSHSSGLFVLGELWNKPK